MTIEDKKLEPPKTEAEEKHVAKTDFKETAIRTAYNIAESTMLIVGEAGKFLGNISLAGAKKIRSVAEQRGKKASND